MAMSGLEPPCLQKPLYGRLSSSLSRSLSLSLSQTLCPEAEVLRIFVSNADFIFFTIHMGSDSFSLAKLHLLM